MTQQTTAAPRHAWSLAWTMQPEGGSKSMTVGVNLALDNPAVIDLQQAQLAMNIEFVQGAFIDNTNNPNPLFVTIYPTKQVVRIEAGRGSYVPLLIGKDNPRLSFSCATSVLTIPVHLVNCSMPSMEIGQGYGSTGQDFSANKPAAPGTAPFNNLLATVPPTARAFIEVQNQSNDVIQLVLDDGAGNNITYIYLNGGGAVGSAGGDWTSFTFNGRLRVYSGNAASQVAIHQD